MGYYDNMNKQQIIDKCLDLENEVVSLREKNNSVMADNAKLNGEKVALNARLKSVEEELGIAKKREEAMWKVINRIMDVEDLVDDLEDAAEELKEAYKENKKQSRD